MTLPSIGAVRAFSRLCLPIAFASAMPSLVTAQSQCVFKTDKVDEFTRQRDLEVTASAFSHGPVFSWRSFSDQKVLRMEWQQNGHVPAVVFQGDSLLLKLENDSVVVLISDDTFVGTQQYDRDGRQTTVGHYDYRVNDQQVRSIAKHWVHKLRIYFRDGYQEFNARPDPSWQLAISRSAGCFMEAFGDKAPVAPISNNGPAKP